MAFALTIPPKFMLPLPLILTASKELVPPISLVIVMPFPRFNVPLPAVPVLSTGVAIVRLSLICSVEFVPAKSIELNVWLPTPLIVVVMPLVMNLRGPKLGLRPIVALSGPICVFWLTSTPPKIRPLTSVFIPPI